MLNTYFKIAFRHLRKNKFFTFLNVAGLTTGLAVTFLISLWVWDEVSYNNYHDNHERIVAVMQNNTFDGVVETWWSQPLPMADALRDNYGSHFEHICLLSGMRTGTLRKGDKILDRRGMYAEASAPMILSFKMIEGTQQALDEPNKILLSASTAKAVFGTENVVGESFTLNEESEVMV
ncbi:MAG: ABC transporter permease, partial [Bacteroidota bacterium]